MPSLVFLAGPIAGRRYKLADGEYVIGRRSDCQIFVPDMRVSRQHARLIKRNVATLLTRAETERLIDRLRPQQAGLLDELIPNIMTLGEVQKVLQNLLREKVSVRNLEAILEVLADGGRANKNPDHLTELVRQRLGLAICQALADPAGSLYVLTLDPAIEHTITTTLRSAEDKATLVLEPRFAEQMLSRIAAQVEKMMKGNVMPVSGTTPS